MVYSEYIAEKTEEIKGKNKCEEISREGERKEEKLRSKVFLSGRPSCSDVEAVTSLDCPMIEF
jgi:hypothetical protein